MASQGLILELTKRSIKSGSLEALFFGSKITYGEFTAREKEYRLPLLKTIRTIVTTYPDYEIWFAPLVGGTPLEDTPFFFLAVSKPPQEEEGEKPEDVAEEEIKNPKARAFIIGIDVGDAVVPSSLEGVNCTSVGAFFTGINALQQVFMLNTFKHLASEAAKIEEGTTSYPRITTEGLDWVNFALVDETSVDAKVSELISDPVRVGNLLNGGESEKLLKAKTRPLSPAIKGVASKVEEEAPKKTSSSKSKPTTPSSSKTKAKQEEEAPKKAAPSKAPSKQKPKAEEEVILTPIISEDTKVGLSTVTKTIKKTDTQPEGLRISFQISLDESPKIPMTWSLWLNLLSIDMSLYIGKLLSLFISKTTKFEHYFVEFSPVSKGGKEPFEICFFDAEDQFEGLTQSSSIFTKYIKAATPGAVATHFSSKGGDGILVIPLRTKASGSDCYLDIASYINCLKTKNKDVLVAYLTVVFEQVMELIPQGLPVWLSTHGTGVGWLHFRLFHEPKHYHDAFKGLAKNYAVKAAPAKASRSERPTTPFGAGVVMDFGELGSRLGEITLSEIPTEDPVLPKLKQPAQPGLIVPRKISLNFPKIDVTLEKGKRRAVSRAASSAPVSKYVDIAQIAGGKGKAGVYYNDRNLDVILRELYPNIKVSAYAGAANRAAKIKKILDSKVRSRLTKLEVTIFETEK